MGGRFRLGLAVVLVALTAGVACVGARGYVDVRRLIGLTEAIDLSRDAEADIRAVNRMIFDAESGQRGFLLTGDGAYLKSYEAARAGALARFDRITARAVAHPDDRGPAEEIRALSLRKFAEMGRTIELERAGDHDGAIRVVRTGEGEGLKRAILDIAEALDRAERARGSDLRLQADRYAGSSLAWLLVLLGGMGTVVVGLYTAVAREGRDRRRVEAELRTSEGRFRGSFEAAAVGMALVAPDGRFLQVNRSLCSSVGYTEEELLARDFQSITHPDDLELDLALVHSLLDGEIRNYRLEKRYIHKDGRPIHAVLGVSLVRDDGRPAHFVSQVEDVTARVEAERAAREERRFIESIAHAVPSILYIYDLDERRNVWANARITEVLGHTTGQFREMGESLLDRLIHPDDLGAMAASHREVRDAADGQAVELEYRARHADGSWRWLRGRDVVFRRGDDGRARQVLGSAEDITDRKRADQRQEAQNRTMLALAAATTVEEAIPGLLEAIGGALGMDVGEFWRVDPAAGVLRLAAEGWQSSRPSVGFREGSRSLSFAPGEGLPGKIWRSGRPILMADVRRDPLFRRDELAREHDLRGAFGLPIAGESGTLGVIALLGAEQREPDEPLLQTLASIGRQVGMFVERRRAGDAVLESERRYRVLAETIPQLVYSCDPDGRSVDFNRRWFEYTGMTREESAGDGSLAAVHPDDLPRSRGRWHESVASVHRHEVEHRLRRADGAYRWHLSLAEPMRDDRGGVVRWFGTCTDIHDQKEAEAALRAAMEAAEAASRAKAEFLANMSHEIRTPMNGVLGMAELAMGTPLSGRQREYVAAIRSSAESLLTVINDILDFSKVEAGKIELDRAPFGLRALLDDTVRAFAPRAAAKGLDLRARVASEAPDVLLGDPHRLRQVIVNLVGNAIKFTERGEVTLWAGPDAEAGPAVEGEAALAFEVIDTGVGVPEARRSAIFEPFEQADGSTTRRFGGTGLGLAISTKLVALMGGAIRVDGRPGGGSVFRFSARFGRPEAEEVPPGAPTGLAGWPVLVVDPDPARRAALAGLLAAWRLEPHEAADGAEALGAIRRSARPFAAALVADGAAARALAAEAGPPLILVGGGATPAEALERAVVARVSGPVRPSELYNALLCLVLDDPPPIGPGEVGGPHRLRVLLAEDNPVNQVVAVHMLERMGHRAVVVGDGREAVAATDSGLFDLVLMDVQMPVMDGFQALAAIRLRERADPARARVPVIALTAHAMQGDRQRCLDAGFDAYLSKPIRAAELSAALAAAPRPDRAAPAGPAPALFRPEVLDEACDGMAGLIAQVLDSFLAQAPVDLDRIARALEAGDLPALRRAAHGLKGACATVGADALADACRRLEGQPDGEDPPGSTGDDLALSWELLRSAVATRRGALDLGVATGS